MTAEIYNNPPVRRVVHVTTVHPRNDMRILHKECRTLASAGYEVHLVVGDGQGEAFVKGIQTYDIGAKPESRIRRMWMQPRLAGKKVLGLKPDIVHLHDPELLPIGVKIAKSGIKVIYDAHEDVPRQTLSRHWIPPIFRVPIAKFFELYENRSVRRLSGVVAATPHIEHRFTSQGLLAINVNNYPLRKEFASVERRGERKKHICYVGTISRMRGVLQVVQALPLMPDVRLTLCGYICEPDLDSELRAEPGWSQVDYLGTVDRATVQRVTGESFAGLVTLFPTPNYLDSLPIKMFEYMAAGLPVIASDFPLWRQIIGDAQCGLLVDPKDSHAIAGAVRWLMEHPAEAEAMGQCGENAARKTFNWDHEAAKLLVLYKKLLLD